VLFILSSVNVSYADSVLTSTEFYIFYNTNPNVKKASKSNGVLTEDLIVYLLNDSEPVGDKVALINAISWGKDNFPNFLSSLAKKHGVKIDSNDSVNKLISKSSASDITCLAYILAMDKYKEKEFISDAQQLIFEAYTKDSGSSKAIMAVYALISCHMLQLNFSWCEVYLVSNALLDNDNIKLNNDFRQECITAILSYTNLYFKHCQE
jgi:hypothetical protein